MRKGRRKDHVWKFRRYRGDIAYYAMCSCGFWYNCTWHEPGNALRTSPDVEHLYNYCPNCGARKTKYTDVEYIDNLEDHN